MIDTHCHLADEKFDADLPQVIANAKTAGVDRMICIADTMAEGEKCLQIAKKYEQIFCTIGVHPHVAKDFDLAKDPERMRQIAAEEKCVAIGEVGLDYYYMNSPKDTQQRVFEKQLMIAKELDLPAVVHCRDAVEDLWTLINHVKPEKLVVHCCTETWVGVERFVAAGYFLSFTGIATYPKSDAIRDTIKHCPMSQLMIETDSPYLAPVPHRGKRNEPAFVAEVLACVATIKGITAAEADAQTTANAEKFFSLR